MSGIGYEVIEKQKAEFQTEFTNLQQHLQQLDQEHQRVSDTLKALSGAIQALDLILTKDKEQQQQIVADSITTEPR